MNPIVQALASEFSPVLGKHLRDAKALKQAIGEALTPEQQLAISPKIVAGPEQFISWISTDVGRSALRELVDKFTA